MKARVRGAVILVGVVSLLGVLVPPLRHWYLHWGTTPDDFGCAMPLDERVARPNLQSTMAITIDVPPERVWPWIVQMGEPPRAGYYSYTAIERMVGLHVHNEARILPEFQTLQVGDTIDANGTMAVLSIKAGQWLVLGPPERVKDVQATWAFVLHPQGEGMTRLVTRVRGQWSLRQMLRSTPPYTWPLYLLVEPGAFIMERKMLRTIKRLAESPHPTIQP